MWQGRLSHITQWYNSLLVILCTLYTILVCMYAMHVVHTGDGFGRRDCSYKHAGIGLGVR